MAFTWKDNEIVTLGDIMHAIDAITEQDEAHAFLAAYQQSNPHAASNIGYLSGYYDRKGMARIQRLFGVAHPIFGTHAPTPEEAFALGRKLGEAAQ